MKVPPKRKGNVACCADSAETFSLNESPSQKEGKYRHGDEITTITGSLNESPSQKEGKLRRIHNEENFNSSLNESPSQKEGKYRVGAVRYREQHGASMKVPPKRKGNEGLPHSKVLDSFASMKVPPKRKGNVDIVGIEYPLLISLNESPSQKEGK